MLETLPQAGSTASGRHQDASYAPDTVLGRSLGLLQVRVVSYWMDAAEVAVTVLEVAYMRGKIGLANSSSRGRHREGWQSEGKLDSYKDSKHV